MTKRFVLVAGNISSGKTSLTERLGQQLGWATAYESVAENPYLSDFYGNMKDWSFFLQIYFLGHRAEQHLALAGLDEPAIIDRSIYEDAEIFARVLVRLGNMTERDYQTYRKLFHIVVGRLPVPDLLIYLRAPADVLLERIKKRGRKMEMGITGDYLILLDEFYETWMENFDLCPVLKIRTDDLDFVHQSQHMQTIISRINDKLAGKEEIEFSDN